jgi:ubiquinone/menaquinone biosynthesis C-methylase UbiE
MRTKPDGDFVNPKKIVHEFGIQHGEVVVDIGCGTGAYVHELSRLVGTAGHVYAIDVQKELLQRLHNDLIRSRIQNVSYIWASVEHVRGTQLADGVADVVLLSNILFQVESVHAALTESKRILKHSGRLIIIDWSDSFGGIGPSKKHVISEGELLAQLFTAGLTVVSDFKAGAHHYGMICKKVIE